MATEDVTAKRTIWDWLWPLVERYLRAPYCAACRLDVLDGHRHLAPDDQPIPYRVVSQ